VRALLEKRKEREAQQACVVEGVRLVEEALAAGWPAELVLHSGQLSARGQELLDELAAAGAELAEVPEALMDSLAGTERRRACWPCLARAAWRCPVLDFALIADNLRDPGNLGTLLRTAAAAGAQAALLSPGTTDAFAPKVLRAGMGAHFRLPVLHLGWDEIRALCKDRPQRAARAAGRSQRRPPAGTRTCASRWPCWWAARPMVPAPKGARWPTRACRSPCQGPASRSTRPSPPASCCLKSCASGGNPPFCDFGWHSPPAGCASQNHKTIEAS
jgi:hypothetical protein